MSVCMHVCLFVRTYVCIYISMIFDGWIKMIKKIVTFCSDLRKQNESAYGKYLHYCNCTVSSPAATPQHTDPSLQVSRVGAVRLLRLRLPQNGQLAVFQASMVER